MCGGCRPLDRLDAASEAALKRSERIRRKRPKDGRRTRRARREAAEAAVAPPDLLAAARSIFLRDGRLEMRALAKELGIGRATLYRKVPDRESLLGDVFLSLGLANFRHAQEDTKTPAGPARVCDVTDLNLKRIRSNKSFERFLHEEPDVAVRVLLDVRGKVYRGWLQAWAEFVRGVERESGWKAPLGADGLSSVMMRVSQAFMFADVYAHDRPDTATPGTVLRLMLGVSR